MYLIKAMLAKISEPVQHSDWYKLLARVEYAINNSVHSTTKTTPCQLLFGVYQRGLEIDSLSEYLYGKNPSGRDLTKLRHTASENIQVAQQHSSDLHMQKHRPHITFSEGDFVVIRNIDTTSTLYFNRHKFISHFFSDTLYIIFHLTH